MAHKDPQARAAYQQQYNERRRKQMSHAREKYIDKRNAQIQEQQRIFRERQLMREANRRQRKFRYLQRSESLRREIAELSVNPFSHLVKS